MIEIRKLIAAPVKCPKKRVCIPIVVRVYNIYNTKQNNQTPRITV